jgi:hypothetical protein
MDKLSYLPLTKHGDIPKVFFSAGYLIRIPMTIAQNVSASITESVSGDSRVNSYGDQDEKTDDCHD